MLNSFLGTELIRAVSVAFSSFFTFAGFQTL
jgi:hypothetical protein